MNDLDASRDDANIDQDGNEASAVGESGDRPSDTGALPRHKWHPHTVKVCMDFSFHCLLGFLYLPPGFS